MVTTYVIVYSIADITKNMLVLDSYEEINEEQLKSLNTDRESSPSSIKIVAGRMLSNGILVDGKQVFLVNTTKLYARSKLL